MITHFTQHKWASVVTLTALFFLAVFASPAWSDTDTDSYRAVDDARLPHMKVSLLSDRAQIAPGAPLLLAVRLQPDEGWHSYWRNPGDTGKATTINWTLPKGFYAGDIEWPVPERINYEGLINFGFHGDTWLLVPVSVPQLDKNIDVIELSASIKWLVCKDVCIPQQAKLALRLPVMGHGSATLMVDPVIQAGFLAAQSRIPKLLAADNARYSVHDKQLVFTVSADVLPELGQPVDAFIAKKGLAANADVPVVTRQGGQLRVVAELDPYFKQPPAFVSVIFSAPFGDRNSSNQHFQPQEISFAYDDVVVVSEPFSPVQEARTASIFLMLLFAFLGGLILNAMPCVFPVLSLKILALAEHRSQSTGQRQAQGMAYTLGVVISFLLVASILMVLRAVGEQIGWGFQLQSPVFVTVLIYLLFMLGLSLSGIFEFGSSLQNIGSGIAEGESSSTSNAFLTGVLATVVATPCTAPFMGVAMGYALSQSVFVALLLFAVMGLGLASPFLLIAWIPALANRLPRPGQWMVTLKEFLAFPIYITVVWLLWVFARQQSETAAALLMLGLVSLAIFAWARLKARQGSVRDGIARFNILWCAFAILLAWFAVDSDWGERTSAVQSDTTNTDYASELTGEAEFFSEAVLSQAIADGKTVFVNMTADWCITCKVNERLALASKKVKVAFAQHGVVYLKGDWTNSDPRITQFLERFERNGVPLYVVYRPNQPPRVLPQILTSQLIIDAVSTPE